MPHPISAPLLILAFSALATAIPLTKRENSEYILPKPVIVLLIILGSGLAVCMGFAVHATFGFKESGSRMKSASAAQMEYMAEVRVRNMGSLMAEGKRSRMESAMAGGQRGGM
ncbi:hypothetical protein TW65_01121 [Stemphylium lycopersici]|uniref:Uncharacterized protein n=1 Tax=Stemphylium lycopersici TaxID=183478 RepID=A0A364N7N2_STELY|nr:hypothetical protein TW65_01121 [Stemphylium lycopersici]RAR13335.1 hypothetical protein DDE83_003334 [Stemphylium lycopersici]